MKLLILLLLIGCSKNTLSLVKMGVEISRQ